MKHWSTGTGAEINQEPIHRKLAWTMFWRRFMKLGIVGEGEMAEQLIDEVAAEIESIMRVSKAEGFEEGRKSMTPLPSDRREE